MTYALRSFLVVIALGLSSPAAAGELIDLFGDWQAFTDVDGQSKRLCHAATIPTKSVGKYKKRGAAYVMVAHFPADKQFDVVSIEAGYTYKPGAEVTVRIDQLTFKLAVDGSTAWARTPKEDRALVRALKAGKGLIVEGVSSRGTKTTDTYSLKGSTGALKAIDRACKKP